MPPRPALIADAPLADAITYGFGDLGPDPVPHVARPEDHAGGPQARREGARTTALGRQERRPESFPPLTTACGRYRLENADAAASTLAALEERFAAERLSVHRVQRDGELLTLDPTLALKRGDRLVVSARRGAFLHAERDIGPEIDDAALLSVPTQTAAVVVTSADVNGATLGALAEDPTRAASTSNRSSEAPS